MAKLIPLFAMVFFQIFGAEAQKYDYNWVLGRSVGFGDLLHFNDYSLQISPINKTIPFYATNACISDEHGNLAFSFNGIKVQNPLHQLMAGTDSFLLGNVPGFYNSSGAATNQGSLALPIAGENNLYRLFYWDNFSFDLAPDTPYFSPRHLYMAIIDMGLNNGNGEVVKKNILLVSDTFANGGINAVQHANGRDWWVIAPKMKSNEYHTILVSRWGIDTTFVQASGAWWPAFADIGTQTCFSPDGSKYVRFCDFYLAQLAPDGKIYLNSWGGCKNLHLIEYPDRPGSDCEFRQHGISLFTYTEVGLPNMPNFRLGPMDGSNCDSLGIDNTPVAAFRYDPDSMTVAFTDLSWYEPITWEWNFGDGGTSTERYPAHTYASLGEYQVCLTVSNLFGTDTYCRVVSVNTSKTDEQNVRSFALSPNPATDEIFIKLPENWSGTTKMEIINVSGIHCLSSTIDAGERTFSISTETLPNGQYICSISTEHRSPLFAKFIVLK